MCLLCLINPFKRDLWSFGVCQWAAGAFQSVPHAGFMNRHVCPVYQTSWHRPDFYAKRHLFSWHGLGFFTYSAFFFLAQHHQLTAWQSESHLSMPSFVEAIFVSLLTGHHKITCSCGVVMIHSSVKLLLFDADYPSGVEVHRNIILKRRSFMGHWVLFLVLKMDGQQRRDHPLSSLKCGWICHQGKLLWLKETAGLTEKLFFFINSDSLYNPLYWEFTI